MTDDRSVDMSVAQSTETGKPSDDPKIKNGQRRHVKTTSTTRNNNNKEKSPTKFGKANPVRDSILLASFLGILLLLSSGETKKKKIHVDDENDTPTTLSTLTEVLQQMANEAAGLRRKDSCSIFLHTGSIPNTGLGYFAGRNYTMGEVLMEDYRTVPVVGSSRNSEEYILYATPSALVLKHHPILHNVQGVLYYHDTNDIETRKLLQLRASKAIREGDEIFVKYDPLLHNTSVFRHIPTISHYHRTGEIVADALRSIPDQAERSGRVVCRMAPVLRFVKQTIGRYDNIVATILPESYQRANQYRTLHPSVATLRNSTVRQLQQMGVCIDDVQPQRRPPHDANDTTTTATNDDNINNFAVTQRMFRKSSVVTTVPLYIMATTTISSSTSSTSQTCELERECAPPQQGHNNNCFAHENMTTILFCPLGPTIIQQQSKVLTNDRCDDTTNNNKNCSTDENHSANVKYQWSQHRGVTEHFVIHESFKYSTSIMAWDVIAVRDITIGEMVIVDGMPQEDVPNHFQSLYS